MLQKQWNLQSQLERLGATLCCRVCQSVWEKNPTNFRLSRTHIQRLWWSLRLLHTASTWRAVIAHLFSAALKRREVMPLVLHRRGREEVLPRLSHTWLAHRLCLIAAPALYPAKWHQTGLCHLSEHCLSCRAGHQQCTHQRRLIYGHWLHI